MLYLFLLCLGFVVSLAWFVLGMGLMFSLPRIIDDARGPLQFFSLVLFSIALSGGTLTSILILGKKIVEVMV